MSEPNFPKMLNAFIIITLFAMLLLGFITGFGANYERDVSEINERIGLTTINSTLESAQTTAESWQSTFKGIGQGNIFSDILDVIGLLSVGMLNLVLNMANFIFIPFEIVSALMVNVLGVPPIVASIVNVLIILGIIFGVWSLIKRGI